MTLTLRESEIVRLVVRGLDNRQLAARLGIRYHTVKNHMTNILRKVRLENRVQLAVWALQEGVVRLDEIELRRLNEVL